jgi:hypothetical protein
MEIEEVSPQEISVSPQEIEAFTYGPLKPMHTLFYDLYWALEPWLPEAEFYSVFLKEYPEKNKQLQNLLYEKKRDAFEKSVYELCVDSVTLCSDQQVSIYGQNVKSERIDIHSGDIFGRISALPEGIHTVPLDIPDEWRYCEVGSWSWFDATLAEPWAGSVYIPQYEYPYALSLEEMHQLRERKIQIAKKLTQMIARYYGFVGICRYKYEDLMDTTDMIERSVWYSLSDRRKAKVMRDLIYSTWFFAFNKSDHPYTQSNYRLFQHLVSKGMMKGCTIEEDDETVLISYEGKDSINYVPKGFLWMDDDIFLEDKKLYIPDA